MKEPRDRVREGLPVRVYRRGDEPGDDLSAMTTPAERLAMVWELTERAWLLQGARPSPYTRATMPIRIIRPR